jgi:hypothetical protein
MRSFALALAVASALVAPAHADPDDGSLSIEHVHHGKTSGWVVRAGDGVHIYPEDFYRLIGREDLLQARAKRRSEAIASLAGGLGLLGGEILLAARFGPSLRTASERAPNSEAPLEIGAALAAAAAPAALIALSVHLFEHPEPISEDEARKLADEFNHTRVAPVVGQHGAGLVVAGTF